MNTITSQAPSFVDNILKNISPLLDIMGRIALVTLFALAALNKIQYYDANAQFLASGGLPTGLLPIVIAFEAIAAAFIIVGFQTRLTAITLAGFSVVTALLYHSNLGDQIQFLMFFKNLAIAGGFLVLASHGAGPISIDAHRK